MMVVMVVVMMMMLVMVVVMMMMVVVVTIMSPVSIDVILDDLPCLHLFLSLRCLHRLFSHVV